MIFGVIAASLVFFARTVLPHRYTPGHIWAYAWAFAWACQAILGEGYLLDPGTVLFVTVCNFAFLLGSYIASPIHEQSLPSICENHRREQLTASSQFRLFACVLFILLGVVVLDVGVKKMGNSGLFNIFSGSFNDFGTSVVQSKAALTDEGIYVTPTEVTIALLLLSCVAVLAGIELALARKDRWGFPTTVALGVGGFAFLASAGTGVRGHLLITAILFASGYLATRIFTDGLSFKLSGRTYIAGVAAIVAFLVWVVVVQSVRRGDFSFRELEATLDYLRPWFAGYLPALSQWSIEADLQGGVYQGDVPGTNVLAGLLSNLGITQGEGATEIINPIAIGEGAISNAMTVFRVLLLDFGYPGTLIVCVVAGYLAQRLYLWVLAGGIWGIVPLAAVYAAALYSFDYWLFARGSRLVGVVIAFVVLAISLLIKAKDGRRLTQMREPMHSLSAPGGG